MKRLFFSIAAALMAAFVVTACEPPQKSAAAQAKETNVRAQQDVIARATAAVPVPRVDNFLTRQNLAEWMKRMDDPAKTWYVYVLGDNGATLGYYVAATYPQSICTFMTPPDEVDWKYRSNGGLSNSVTTAPALDGVYYKGGGCDTYFFFDASSSALIQLTGMKLWSSDVPLDLDAPQIRVVGKIE